MKDLDPKNLVLAVLLAIGWVCSYSAIAHAQTYVRSNDGSILYEKLTVPYTAYSYGKPYTAYRYEYRKVVSKAEPNWRDKLLNIIYQQKEAEAYQEAINLIAPRSGATAYAQAGAAAYNYPSQTGSTLGAFSKVEYSRYGSTQSVDVNRHLEAAQIGLDTYQRATADATAQAATAHGNVAALIDRNRAGITALGELQETRATLRELMVGLTQQTLAQSHLVNGALGAMKPKDNESFNYESGVVQGQATARAGVSGGGYAAGDTPPPAVLSQPPAGITAEHAGLIKRYCAACHSGEAAQGGFVFDGSVPLSEADFGLLALRVDPSAPDTRGNGKPYRMPPADSAEQPSVEERRAIVDAAKLLVQP